MSGSWRFQPQPGVEEEPTPDDRHLQNGNGHFVVPDPGGAAPHVHVEEVVDKAFKGE